MSNIQNREQKEDKVKKRLIHSYCQLYIFCAVAFFFFFAVIWLCLLFAVFATLMCAAFVELPGCIHFYILAFQEKVNDSIYLLESFNFLVSSIVTPVEILSLYLITLSQVKFKLIQILVLMT